jgi:HSP90 family molecular chaperone
VTALKRSPSPAGCACYFLINTGRLLFFLLCYVCHESIQLEEANKQLADLLVFLKDALSDRIEKVTLTSRLLDSPCALVTSKFGWSANMERIMRSQAMGDSRAMDYMKGRKILEVNPEHEIVRGIKVRLVGLWNAVEC